VITVNIGTSKTLFGKIKLKHLATLLEANLTLLYHYNGHVFKLFLENKMIEKIHLCVCYKVY
jgi:hypothetical protein